MLFPSKDNMHWSIESSICYGSTMGESEPVTVNNRVSPILTISEVVNFILNTRGDFLQLATITKKPGAK